MKVHALLLLLTLLLAATAAFAEQSAFKGRWQLDPERSDRPERSNRRQLRSLERTLDEEPHTSLESMLAPMRQPHDRLRISLGTHSVTLYSGAEDEDPEHYHTDGRPATVDSARRTQSLAAWEDGRLYIERVSLQGLRILEVWSLQDDRLQVDVEARTTLLEQPIRYRLSYVRAE